jgi:AGCS family alanine or glycine:cation symporter
MLISFISKLFADLIELNIVLRMNRGNLMRIIRYFPILPLTLGLLFWAGNATTGNSQETATSQESVPPAAEPAGETTDSAQATETSATEPNGKHKSSSAFEEKIDKIAEWCAGKIAAVMFYEIIGRQEFSRDIDGAVTDVEAIRKLVQEAEAKGLNPQELDYTLTLPVNSLSEQEAKALQIQLGKDFTTGRTRSFQVKVAERDNGKQLAQTSKFSAGSKGIPLVVLWLVLGSIFFTLRMGFINFRGFKHAVMVTAGKFDNPADEGEVSHFQALSAALSATVGLGNIAGVAIAVMTGGPGATFWMIMAGLLGMSAKFTECTLGQKYREVRPDGRIMGGAMFYLSNGLKELHPFGVSLAKLGKVLGVLFAVLCVLASFGGGNAFQVNQSMLAVEKTIPILEDYHWLYGLIMAVLVGVVIIGGIRRIAATAEKIVPLMCGVYVLACLWILLKNVSAIPEALQLIVTEAFTPQAGYGGFLGVLILGFRRAAFSNEAGVGSAAIAHSAAKTDYPVREGIVALLEPFIDTVVICTMTALVIVITGAYNNPDYAQLIAAKNGAALTSNAMRGEIWWFPYILSVAVILFAYSTMISWSYYGERCWAYLFGDRASLAYRIIFLVFIVLGSITSATNVLDLSDLMILGMAFPNVLGVALLSGKVKRDLDDYWKRYKAGELEKTT